MAVVTLLGREVIGKESEICQLSVAIQLSAILDELNDEEHDDCQQQDGSLDILADSVVGIEVIRITHELI